VVGAALRHRASHGPGRSDVVLRRARLQHNGTAPLPHRSFHAATFHPVGLTAGIPGALHVRDRRHRIAGRCCECAGRCAYLRLDPRSGTGCLLHPGHRGLHPQEYLAEPQA